MTQEISQDTLNVIAEKALTSARAVLRHNQEINPALRISGVPRRLHTSKFAIARAAMTHIARVSHDSETGLHPTV